MDTRTHLDRSMKIKRWMLSDTLSSRATWQNLSTHLQSNGRDLITTIRELTFNLSGWSKMKRRIQRSRSNSSINRHVLRRKNLFLNVLSKSNCLEYSVLESLDFFFFLYSSSVWNQDLVERIGRNHLLDAEIYFEIIEWKTLNPAINWIISSATSG